MACQLSRALHKGKHLRADTLQTDLFICDQYPAATCKTTRLYVVFVRTAPSTFTVIACTSYHCSSAYVYHRVSVITRATSNGSHLFGQQLCMTMRATCSFFRCWKLNGLTRCPQDILSHSLDTGSPTCNAMITIDKNSWETHCKRKQLLEACTSQCITLSVDHPELCVAKHAGLTLILLWCTLAGLLSIMVCTYIVVRIKLVQHNPGDNSKFSQLMNKVKQGWAHVLQWRPWGVKVAALFGLATFWYDKGSDVKLLSDVWGHTWTGYALLVFLLYQYVLQGYILMFHLICACKLTWLFEARLFRVLRLKRPFYFAFMLCPLTGVLMMIGLDVSLFVSDLGYSIPIIDRHFDLEEYQLFRDIGRALFGTVPTAILQSVTFTTGSTPQNGLVLTTQTFVSAIVASGLQLLKVTGELMYLALQGKASMHTVFWRLLVGKHVVREALETKSSDLLPQGQIISSQPDAVVIPVRN